MGGTSTGRDWARSLNPAQREAVAHVQGPMLVLAGAGSGKTRVLTTRIAVLIDQHGVPPQRIFSVTFTNKAAGEMKERVGRLLGHDPAGLWIGTFHSLSARLLRREAERLGFSRQFTIYDEDDRLALIRRMLEQRSLPPKLFPARAVQAIISAAKNRMQSPEALAAQPGFDRLVQVSAELMGPLATRLREQNAMDFDDLMLHPLRLFREHPDRLAWWRDRFAFLLVDEFQDTNRAQYELVKLLGSGHRNVFAVGDDDQSIYGWRGAEVRNMRDFQSDFTGCRLVRLEENYRSTRIILDAANAAISRNSGRLGKTLRTRRPGGEAVTVLSAADERDEAEWIARELGRRAAGGDWALEDMAILYRTNSQSRALEESLRRAGMAYRIVGAISFYERREVKDLLAYLRLVANPADDEAFLRAVGAPRRGIGETSLEAFRGTAGGWSKSLLEAARIADRATGLRPNVRAALVRFAELIDALRTRSGDVAPAILLEDLVHAIDYEAVLRAEG
ncbi:MAG TPA: UvrD-helicase domain-containing protein, partial [Gemmatimonadales bacterium]|nr:UvrD-helicase domain-containing protein [Gemmatimonadales bacterium]